MEIGYYVPVALVAAAMLWVGGLKAYRAVAGEPNDTTSSSGGSKRNKSSKTKKHIATQSKRRRS